MPLVGRYQLLAEVGKGGMGVVYRAFDPKIGREVALKTILTGVVPDSTNYAELRRRLEREARAAGALNHPGIVTVYDVGEWNDSFYIAMEFVPGTPLDRVIKGGKALSYDAVLSVIGQVASALDYAHTRKIVHRDIKPANLIYLDDGRIKITDFGIAYLSQDSITQEGGRVGSPSYMSPEQIEGGEIDGRTDFFSLGVVFYQLLTGRKPFRGKNVPAITHAICHAEPEPPSRYNKSLPRRVDIVVLKLLSKVPELRYASGQELAKELGLLRDTGAVKVTIDYGAPPPREEVRERTPTPAPAARIDHVFRNITSDARSFSLGERSGTSWLSRKRGVLLALGAGAVCGLAALAVFWLR